MTVTVPPDHEANVSGFILEQDVIIHPDDFDAFALKCRDRGLTIRLHRQGKVVTPDEAIAQIVREARAPMIQD